MSLARTFAALAGEGAPVPWRPPYADAARRLVAAGRAVQGAAPGPLGSFGEPGAVAAVLNVAVPTGPRFVPQAALPPGEAYEAYIARTGAVPTRDHPHDLLNGLVWARFPALKARLNRLQAAEIARLGIGPRRGPVRDALTLFDESAAWLQAPPALVDALAARAWRTAFVDLRAAWADARLTLFGHALMEGLLLAPHKGITAHVWVVPPGADAEAFLVDHLTPERLARKADFPLPLAGVPGWWPGNDAPDFVDDTTVFRPKRR